MKNRISHTIDPKQIDQLNESIDKIKSILLNMVSSAQLDEMGSGLNMGTEGGWQYCQNGYAAAIKYPKLYDSEELNIQEFEKDIILAKFLNELKKSIEIVDNYASLMYNLVGKDLMEQTQHIRLRAVQKQKINLEYAPIAEEPNRLYAKRAEKASETKKINQTIKDLKEQIKKP